MDDLKKYAKANPGKLNFGSAGNIKALRDPETLKIWLLQGATVSAQSPKEFVTFISSEITKWAKVVKDANIKIDN